jgi:hypothetical protein
VCVCVCVCDYMRPLMCYCQYLGARRRHTGSGPGGGCVHMPVGTYLYLHAVGAGNPVALQGLAR